MSKKNLIIINAILLFIIALVALDFFVNLEFKKDLSQTRKIMKADQEIAYRENYEPSQKIFYADDNFVYYKDRLLKHFKYKAGSVENFVRGWNNLSKEIPKDVNLYVVPIPTAILVEDRHQSDIDLYQKFYTDLETSLKGQTKVIDILEDLNLYKNDYVFYKASSTSSSITALGGYYGANKVLSTIGVNPYLKLSDYQHHLYVDHILNISSQALTQFEKNSQEYKLLKAIPNDWTHYYKLYDSFNVSEVFYLDDNDKLLSKKRPTLVKSGLGSGAIIGSQIFEHAVVEGDRKSEVKKDKTLLYISDNSGKYLLPYLSNYYKKVYYINSESNLTLGSEKNRLAEIFKNYDIDEVVYSQNSFDMANFKSNLLIKRYLEKEGER